MGSYIRVLIVIASLLSVAHAQVSVEKCTALFNTVDQLVGINAPPCDIHEGATGQRAEFIRFMQSKMLPVVNLLDNFQCEKKGGVKKRGSPDCLSPCEIAERIIKAVQKPCDTVESLDSLNQRLKKLLSILKGAKRMPYIKTFAILAEPALKPHVNNVDALVRAGKDKCAKMEARADQFFEKLRSKLADAKPTFKLLDSLMNQSVREACLVENYFNKDTSSSASHRHSHVVRSLRMMDGALPGTHQRFLAHQEDLIDFSPWVQAETGVQSLVDSLSSFGESLDSVAQVVEETAARMSDFFKKLDPLFDKLELVGDIGSVLSSIVDKLSFMKCPSFLGFICNLDQLAVGVVQEILKAFGLDVNKMVSDFVDDLLRPLQVPDPGELIRQLGNIDFFANIDLDADLFSGLKIRTAPILQALNQDPFDQAFNDSPEPDVAVDFGDPLDPLAVSSQIDLTFYRAKGSKDEIRLSCPASKPLALTIAGSVQTACGFTDLTGKLEILCCGQNSVDCRISLSQYLTWCSSGPKIEAAGYGYVNGMTDASTLLYTCITEGDLKALKPLPDIAKANLVPNGQQLVCQPGSVLLPLGVDMKLLENRRLLASPGFWDWDGTGLPPPEWGTVPPVWTVPPREWGGTFEAATESSLQKRVGDGCRPNSETCPMFENGQTGLMVQTSKQERITKTRYCHINFGLFCAEHRDRWSCRGSRPDLLSVVTENGKYSCLQPGRDIVDDGSNLHVAFHIGVNKDQPYLVGPSAGYFKDRCTNCNNFPRHHGRICSGVETGPLGVRYFYPNPVIAGGLRMGCPRANQFIKVLEVYRDTVQNTNRVTESVLVTNKFAALCDNKKECSPDHSGELLKKCGRVHLERSIYTCLCGGGFDLEPRNGQCFPCAEGSYRRTSQHHRSLFPIPIRPVENMEQCEPCPVGFYADQPGQSSCSACQQGFFSSIEGAFSCVRCPRGHETWGLASKSSTQCIPCAPFQYSSSAGDGNIVCTDCPPGYWSDAASSKCHAVKPGYFASLQNYRATGELFSPCQPGTYNDGDQGMRTCKPCQAGTYSCTKGASACSSCPWGTYSDTSGQVQCTPCPGGQFHKEFGASSIQSCQTVASKSWNDLKYINSSCKDLLRETLDDPSNEAQLEVAVRQTGNGICNGGAWNTAQCNYDGGDCCPETCTVPPGYETDQLEAILSCTWTTWDCQDPQYKVIPIFALPGPNGESRPSDLTRTPGTEICLDDEDLVEGSPSDGVCDPELNTSEHGFDGGDCCISTCEPRSYYPQSCLSNCQCKL